MIPIAGLDALVQAFAHARGTDPAPALQRQELAKPLAGLDRVYWEQTSALLEGIGKNNLDRMVFNKYERMLMDLGLMDLRLVPEGEKARILLLKELYEKAPPHIQYFSEWMGSRYRTFILYGRLESPDHAKSVGSSLPVAKSAAPSDGELDRLRDARGKILERLRPLFQNLPGFQPPQIELLFSGKIDGSLEQLMSLAAQKDDPRISDQMRQLTDVRGRMLTRARERAATEDELKLFDALYRVDEQIATRAVAAPPSAAAPGRPAPVIAAPAFGNVPPAERVKFIQGELKLVRNLVKLGVAGAGITRTASVLTSIENRASKGAALAVLAQVKECDPSLPASPNIVIAPYTGTGFYEWDRDSVFIPLTPTRNVEESIVAGLANYRIMLDTLHGGGRLKRAFEMRFEKTDFRSSFLRDYRNWVLGTGKGFRGAMAPEAYDFFRMHIGPSIDDLFAPAEIARKTPEERTKAIGECRRKVNRAEADPDTHYELAVHYWKESRPRDALDQLAVTVKMYPVDGRSLFALGHVCQSMGIENKAQDAYQECINVAENTVWHVYAQDALQKLK